SCSPAPPEWRVAGVPCDRRESAADEGGDRGPATWSGDRSTRPPPRWDEKGTGTFRQKSTFHEGASLRQGKIDPKGTVTTLPYALFEARVLSRCSLRSVRQGVLPSVPRSPGRLGRRRIEVSQRSRAELRGGACLGSLHASISSPLNPFTQPS